MCHMEHFELQNSLMEDQDMDTLQLCIYGRLVLMNSHTSGFSHYVPMCRGCSVKFSFIVLEWAGLMSVCKE